MAYKGAITGHDRVDFLVLILVHGRELTQKQMMKHIKPSVTIAEYLEYMDAVLADCVGMGYLEIVDRKGKKPAYKLTEKGFYEAHDFFD